MEHITAVEKIGPTDKKEPETDASTATPVANAAGEPSKNALKKAQKEAEKARKKAERAAATAAQQAAKAADTMDMSEGKYGVLPLIQSADGDRKGIDPNDAMTD